MRRPPPTAARAVVRRSARRRGGPVAAVLAAALGAAGCGSAGAPELRPPAQPARSPALTSQPAGRVFAVGARPTGVVADPGARTFLVAERDPDGVRFVDARTGRTARRAPATAGATDAVFALPSAAAPANALAVGRRSPAVTAVAGRVFVADVAGDAVSVLAGGRRIGRFAVGARPTGLSPADRGRLLAVVSGRERVLELYDPRTLRRVARARAGVGPTHVAAEAGRLYVADTAGGALLVFGLRPKLRLTRRVALPGSPYGLTVDPARHRLWVTLTGRNELVSLPADDRPRPLVRLPTVRQPDAVAVDLPLGTVAVTGRHAGVLQLVGPAEAYPDY